MGETHGGDPWGRPMGGKSCTSLSGVELLGVAVAISAALISTVTIGTASVEGGAAAPNPPQGGPGPSFEHLPPLEAVWDKALAPITGVTLSERNRAVEIHGNVLAVGMISTSWGGQQAAPAWCKVAGGNIFRGYTFAFVHVLYQATGAAVVTTSS